MAAAGAAATLDRCECLKLKLTDLLMQHKASSLRQEKGNMHEGDTLTN